MKNVRIADVETACDASSIPHPATTTKPLESQPDKRAGSASKTERTGNRVGRKSPALLHFTEASEVGSSNTLEMCRRVYAGGSMPHASSTSLEGEPDKRAGTVLKTVGTERSGGQDHPLSSKIK
jgi:hypothetical protein